MRPTDAALKARWENYRSNFPAIFWKRVEKSAGPNGCWPYRGSRWESGYGKLRLYGRNTTAHRVAYALHCGDPGKMFVLHSCDNPPCCNPAHLFLGTHQDNMDDRRAKGRATMCRAKLQHEQVKTILVRLHNGEMGAVLAVEYGVSETAISRIKLGRTWTTLRARSAMP